MENHPSRNRKRNSNYYVLHFALYLYHRHLIKISWLIASSVCFVCLVSIVSGCHKNAIGKGSACSGHIAKLEQFTFLWISMIFTYTTFKTNKNPNLLMPVAFTKDCSYYFKKNYSNQWLTLFGILINSIFKIKKQSNLINVFF